MQALVHGHKPERRHLILKMETGSTLGHFADQWTFPIMLIEAFFKPQLFKKKKI